MDDDQTFQVRQKEGGGKRPLEAQGEKRLLQFQRDDRSLQKQLWKSAAMQLLPCVEALRKTRQVFTSELVLD